MPTIHANGLNIYYEVSGSGAPLVLMAGLGADRWMWLRLIPALAPHFQVIAFDNRGVGKTDNPPGPSTAQMLAGDTAALIAGLGLEQASVMGHSMGGLVAQALALARPDLIRRLILSATYFGGPHAIPDTDEARHVMSDLAVDPGERLRRLMRVGCAPGFVEAHPDLVQQWVTYRVANPVAPELYQAQLAVGAALKDPDTCLEPKLKAVPIPTLIVLGAHDKRVPPGNAEWLHRALPNSMVRSLLNGGHALPLEIPEEAAAAVIEFLQEEP